MRSRVIFLFLCVSVVPGWAGDPGAFPDLDINNVGAVREASRVLEEELKLAARPQTYVVIDLALGTMHMKGRGIELHRMTIGSWSATGTSAMTGTFRLQARPSVARRKVDPGIAVGQEPISLADMPVQYAVSLVPSLTVEIHPPASEHPWLWSLASSRIWWRQLKEWTARLGDRGPPQPSLELTVSAEQAQSFAWSLVDGMPVVIRRSADQ